MVHMMETQPLLHHLHLYKSYFNTLKEFISKKKIIDLVFFWVIYVAYLNPRTLIKWLVTYCQVITLTKLQLFLSVRDI